MKKTMLLSLLSGVLFILTMESCVKKILGWDGNYTIQGKLLKNCGGEPIPDYHLTLVYTGGFNNSNGQEWQTHTDENGNFSFTLPINRNKDLRLVHWGGNMSTGMPQDGDIINWTFYEKQEEVLNVKFNINASQFNPNDTMYIGTWWGYYHYLNPIPSFYSQTFTKNHSVPARAVDSSTFGIYWAIGKIFYDSLTKSQNKPDNWKDYYFTAIGKSCINTDTTVVTIP